MRSNCCLRHQYALFIQDIPKECDVTVFLGGADSIIPSHQVQTYLNTTRAKVHFHPHLNHAGFLFDNSIENSIIDMIGRCN